MFPWLRETKKEFSDSKIQEIQDLKKDVDSVMGNKNIKDRRAVAKERDLEDRNRKREVVRSQIFGSPQSYSLKERKEDSQEKYLVPSNKYEQGIQTTLLSESGTQTDFAKGGKFHSPDLQEVATNLQKNEIERDANIFIEKERNLPRFKSDENLQSRNKRITDLGNKFETLGNRKNLRKR